MSSPRQDDSPAVSVDIIARTDSGSGGKRTVTSHSENRVLEYSLDSDVLSLGDPFALTLMNPDGSLSPGSNADGQRMGVNTGNDIKLYISDPLVKGGQKTLWYAGIITGIRSESAMQGTKLMLTGADLGWHLSNNTGPVHLSYKHGVIGRVLKDVLESSWGLFYDEKNKNLVRKGRTTRQQATASLNANVVNTPVIAIQFEPGQSIADVLIALAKRLGLLVNVSPQGEIRFFKPVYDQQPSYFLYHYKVTDPRRSQNNILSASVEEHLDSIWTEVTCVGQTVYPPELINANIENPNAGKFKGLATKKSVLPFVHRTSFGDGDMLNQKLAQQRAVWKMQRGQFDAWTASYTVQGHSQGGQLYEPDTIIHIDDDVLNVRGKFYVSAVRYNRNQQQGTTTQLTIKKPGLLGA